MSNRQFVSGSVEWLIAYRDGVFKHVPYIPLPPDRPAPLKPRIMSAPSNTWNNRIARLIERDGNACHYCRLSPLYIRGELAGERYADATIDHKIPRCRGGSNEMENLVLACRKCNHEKADDSYEYFMAQIRRRVQRPQQRARQGIPAGRPRPTYGPTHYRSQPLSLADSQYILRHGKKAWRAMKEQQGAPTAVPIAYDDPKAQAAFEAVYKDRLYMLRSDPTVKAVLDRFPGAEIVGIRESKGRDA